MKSVELLKFDPSLKLVREEMNFEIEGISPVDMPSSFHLHFIKNKKFAEKFFTAQVNLKLESVTVVIDKKLYDDNFCQTHMLDDLNIILSDNVPLSLAKISFCFYQKSYESLDFFTDARAYASNKIDPSVKIAPDVFIGKYVEIGEGSQIHSGVKLLGKIKIGKNVTLYPNVVVYPNCEILDHTRIHASTTVGSDGFGYVFDGKSHVKIWHYGGVKIGKNVEIGANSAIDSGTFRPTIIEDGCIIDNQVQIAHNTQLGMGVIMCGQSGTAGSTKIGMFSVLGGKAGVANDLEIGKCCQIAAGSVVNCNWEDNSKVAGYPARPLNQWLRAQAQLNALSKKEKKCC